jgi:hypothetical protein
MTHEAGGVPGDAVAPELVHHIEELRRQTLESKDLSVPALYFHERLVTHPDFPALGSASEDATLGHILDDCVRRVLPGFQPQRWHMMQVESCSFWHGMAEAFPVGLAVFFYFDDAGMGVVEATALGNANAHYLRFTAVPGAAAHIPSFAKRGQA